ncbi:MAG: O-antigen ligase family protein [Oscillospiraceae bacterium]|nr:O-antigen ligase family protein [Oscillospiraceae bacterium]
MLTAFCSAAHWAIHCLLELPVRCLRPIARGRTGRLGGLLPHQWFFLLGISGMFCVPHQLWDNRYAAVFAALMLLIYCWDLAALDKQGFDPLLPDGMWVFLIFCFLSCLWAWDRTGSLRVTVFFLAGFSMAAVSAAAFREPRARDTLFAALYASLIFTSVYGLIVYYTREGTVLVPIDGVAIQRLCSTLEHGINYSEFVAMLLPPMLIWALQRPNRALRVMLTALLLFPIAALLLTYGRTGWVSLAAAVLVLLWLTERRLLVPAACLGVVCLFLLPHTVQSRLLTLLDFSDTGSSGRFTLWKECFALWREHWLWGVGLGPENFFHAYLPVSTGTLPFLPPHSNMLYLEMAISLGCPGFLAFLAFFFPVFPRLGRAMDRCGDPQERHRLAALYASLFGAAVGAIPEYIWFYPRILFCWCILYGLALGSIKDPADK